VPRWRSLGLGERRAWPLHAAAGVSVEAWIIRRFAA
jgi:hypothetical protein